MVLHNRWYENPSKNEIEHEAYLLSERFQHLDSNTCWKIRK